MGWGGGGKVVGGMSMKPSESRNSETPVIMEIFKKCVILEGIFSDT